MKSNRVIRELIEWDEFSAYLYGYIVGDGCLVKRTPYYRKSGELVERLSCINIKSIDVGLLKYLAELGNLPITFNKTRVGKDLAVIQVHSAQWVKFLVDHGIVSNKSIMGMKLVKPDKHLWAFIRGVFDSDGCVTKNTKHILRVSLMGHPSYINEVANWTGFNFVSCSEGKIDKPYLMKIEDVKQFYEVLYKDATIFNARKKKAFDEWIYNRKIYEYKIV